MIRENGYYWVILLISRNKYIMEWDEDTWYHIDGILEDSEVLVISERIPEPDMNSTTQE